MRASFHRFQNSKKSPSQRPRLPRRPHWRSSPQRAQVHAPPTLPAAGTVPTAYLSLSHTNTSLISPLSPTASIHTSPHIHGAAPPRLSHQTTPPDPRQPYPTRSLTAQPHPTPYRGTHGDRSSATVPAPLPPPPPRKGPPRSNRATPCETGGRPLPDSPRRRPIGLVAPPLR